MNKLFFIILSFISLSISQNHLYSFTPHIVPELTEFNITLSDTNFRCNTQLGGLTSWVKNDSIFLPYIIINKNFINECVDSTKRNNVTYSFYGLNKGIYKVLAIQGSQCWGIFCNPVKDTTYIGKLFIYNFHKHIKKFKCDVNGRYN